MPSRFRILLTGTVALGALAVAAPAAAQSQSVADFYKGRTVTMVVSAGPGGSYGLYAQVLIRYWPKYIPGTPTMVIQYMGGSGGVQAANYLHNAAMKDGSVVGMPLNTSPIAQYMRPKGVRYDIAQWNWIGNMAVLPGTIGVWASTGVKSIDDAKAKEVIMGATARTSTMAMFPRLLNSTVGTKFKIVMGYKGVATMDKAMETGEIEGHAASWTAWKTTKPDWIRENRINILVQIAAKRAPDLPDVPLLNELAQTQEQRKMFGFMTATTEFGRIVMAPPGVPTDRVAALRDAFNAVMKDPELIADAESKGAPIQPQGWRDMEELAKEMTTLDPKVIEALTKALGLTGGEG